MRGYMRGRRPIFVGMVIAMAVLLSACALPTRIIGRSGPSGPMPQSGVRYMLNVACPPERPTCDMASGIAQTTQMLLKRLQLKQGNGYASVQQPGPATLQITVPGATDSPDVESLLTTRGVLTFLDTGETEVPPGTTVTAGEYPVAFTGDQLNPTSIAAELDPNSNGAVLIFAFQGSARQQFATYTQKHIGEYLTIALDNTFIESAVIQTEIDGNGQITGLGSLQQAQDLATQLKSRALPLTVTITATENYGPSGPVAIATAA